MPGPVKYQCKSNLAWIRRAHSSLQGSQKRSQGVSMLVCFETGFSWWSSCLLVRSHLRQWSWFVVGELTREGHQINAAVFPWSTSSDLQRKQKVCPCLSSCSHYYSLWNMVRGGQRDKASQTIMYWSRYSLPLSRSYSITPTCIIYYILNVFDIR